MENTLSLLTTELHSIDTMIDETCEWKATELIKLELTRKSLMAKINRILEMN